MSFKKDLEPGNASIFSFETYKDFTLTNVDSGSGLYVVPIIKGTSSNLSNFNIDTTTSKTISEIEINPLFVYADKVCAVDALIHRPSLT